MSDTPQNAASQREESTLAWWREHKIFEKSVEKKAPHGEYVFYDGPPFATGLPHYGHIVASVIKDAVPRYWTMRGYSVPRVWGWDCHGLPIENIVEKELGFKHKKDIRAYGVAKFNEMCRERVLTYAAEWEKIIPRIGRWADMEHAYRTMDKSFMESVWWVFKQLWDKGLVYEDYRVMHICPRCETTLSQQEVSEGYKDVKDIAVTVKFPVIIEGQTKGLNLTSNSYFLAWTTTPWTLPGNVALAINPRIEYGAYERDGETFILAVKRAGAYGFENPRVTWPGSQLRGVSYKPPFDYYYNDVSLKRREGGWHVYSADFVNDEDGTGIAHEAPAFGADDWALLKQYDLPFVQHVNFDGTFKSEVKDFAGMEVKPLGEDKVRLGADIAVIKYLQEHGTFFSKDNLTHSYPHCWRCDSPLLNYATSSWFVNVTKVKGDMLENAKPINWSPAHIKEGRWGNWLEGARDWSVSRQRFWASVMPIWVCERCKEKRVFGSAAELEEASGQKIDDLHKHIVDDVVFPCPACAKQERSQEFSDVRHGEAAPVDVPARTAEGGAGPHNDAAGNSGRALMKRVPDVLDTWFDSGSMPYGSKHYPFERKERFDATFPAQFIAEGIDQTRAWFYYLHVLGTALFQRNAFSNVIVNGIVLAEDGKKMSKKLKNYPDPMDIVHKHGADALRLYLLASPVMQAENLNFSEKGVVEWKGVLTRLENVLSFYELYRSDLAHEPSDKSERALDRWILARLHETQKEMTRAMDAYDLTAAARPLAGFVDDLSQWYLRRSRERIKGADEADKRDALATMLYSLREFAKVLAPFAPFMAEHLWRTLARKEDEESVHLAEWPHAQGEGIVVAIFGRHDDVLAHMEATRRIVTEALEARDAAKIKVRQPLASLAIPGDTALPDEYLQIIADEVNVKEVVARGDKVALDTVITDELREEGAVREFIRAVQSARKDAGMQPRDKGKIVYGDELDGTLAEKYREQILAATNATELIKGEKLAVEKI